MLNVVSDIRTLVVIRLWIGMIGRMAVDNCETVWTIVSTIVAVEVLVRQICFYLRIHYLTYFLASVLRYSDSTCAL